MGTNCNCSTVSSVEHIYMKFDNGMPVLVSGADNVLSAIQLSLKDWNLEISKYGLNRNLLSPLQSISLILPYSVIYIRSDKSVRVGCFLPSAVTPTNSITVNSVCFINLGVKYSSVTLTNDSVTDTVDVSLFTVLDKILDV